MNIVSETADATVQLRAVPSHVCSTLTHRNATITQNPAPQSMTRYVTTFLVVGLLALCPVAAFAQAPLAPVAHQTFFDSNGDPLALGTLETYIAGTVTPKVTYSDSTLLTANPTTITFNASGRPTVSSVEVPLYLGTGSYKFIVKNAAGSVQYTQDYVTGIFTGPTILSKSGAYSVTTSDGPDVLIKCDASAGSFSVIAYTAVGNAGSRITIKKTDSSTNTCILDGNATETIDGSLTATIYGQYEVLTVESDGTNWQRVVRNVDLNLTRPTLTNFRETKATGTISTNTLAVDLANGNHFAVALSANISTFTIANVPATGNAATVTFIFTADGSVRTIVWPTGTVWSDGTAPTMTGTNAKRDIVTLYTVDGGTVWFGVVAGQNF